MSKFQLCITFLCQNSKKVIYHQRIDDLVPVIFSNITVQKGEVRFFGKTSVLLSSNFSRLGMVRNIFCPLMGVAFAVIFRWFELCLITTQNIVLHVYLSSLLLSFTARLDQTRSLNNKPFFHSASRKKCFQFVNCFFYPKHDLCPCELILWLSLLLYVNTTFTSYNCRYLVWRPLL